MSTSRVALAARDRKPSKNAFSPGLFGGAAIACLVLGSAYTVYSNIIAASVYPTLGDAAYDEPVVRARPQQLSDKNASQVVNDGFAALPGPAPVIGRPETVEAVRSPSLMFSERFAAAKPQGVDSRAAEAAPPQPPAPKVAEAPKAKDTKIALNLPAPKPAAQPGPEAKQTEVKPAEAKPA